MSLLTLSDLPVEEDPLAAAPDLEFIADPCEIEDLDWRRADLDILDMYDESDLVPGEVLDGESAGQAEARWASVRSWMEARGGAAAALSESPVIAILDDDMTPVDGWHRCVIAWHDYGLRSVPGLVGMARPAPRNDDLPVMDDMPF